MTAYEHQEYPKWVDTTEVERTFGPDNKPVYKRVLVQNEKEEAELSKGKPKPVAEEPKKEEPKKEEAKKPWVDPKK